ncbi:UNVERIFIED_CONTAM: hypothetical protein K2H54_029713 [Gekko kuhli]
MHLARVRLRGPHRVPLPRSDSATPHLQDSGQQQSALARDSLAQARQCASLAREGSAATMTGPVVFATTDLAASI